MASRYRLIRLAVGMLAALGALWFVTWFVQAQGEDATVRVIPASRDVDIQSSYALTITVEDAQDLGGFEFDLAFDPTLLRVDDVTLGDFLASTGRNTGELGPDIDNNAGVVTYGAFSYGSPLGPEGTGCLAVVLFTTYITPGTSALDLQKMQLVDTQAVTQSVQATAGSITILTGPRVGTPVFASSVPSSEPLTVTVPITNTINGTGVSTATLRYGYTSPYTQTYILGTSPGGNGDGVWTFVILPQGPGHEGQTLRFSLVAQDGDVPPGEAVNDNNASYYSVTIENVNYPPEAVDDTAITPEDTPHTIDVLDNDTDPDDDTLSVIAVGAPPNGTASTDGATVMYTPTLNYNGQDIFTYIVSDGVLTDTATITVTVTAVNDPPTAADDSGSGFVTGEDVAFTTSSVLTNDSDPDTSDTLSVSGLDTSSTEGSVTDNGDGAFGQIAVIDTIEITRRMDATRVLAVVAFSE